MPNSDLTARIQLPLNNDLWFAVKGNLILKVIHKQKQKESVVPILLHDVHAHKEEPDSDRMSEFGTVLVLTADASTKHMSRGKKTSEDSI